MGLALLWAAGCAAPKAQFTDADWVSNSTTGRGCYERGDFRRGADAYGRAQQRARALDDADALAVSAVNRAVCLLAESKAGEALAAVDEALADARVSMARRAELLVAGARAKLALGKPDDAVALAGEALNLDPPPVLWAQALLAQSAASLAQGDAQQAAKELAFKFSAKDWAKLPADLRAEYAARRGEIAASEKKPAEAMALQDEAAALWKKAGRLPEMARALAEAGRQAKASGDLAGACDRFYRAARSLWAQGLQPEAVRILEEGVACAEELKDEAIGKRMADLFVTFQDSKRLSK
ncbi:MAG TPA: hypothetical protein DCM68_05025 [Verrucomicrobia bacterium]|nr:hypothetical protein [Verrucomicrobiota bacterium]